MYKSPYGTYNRKDQPNLKGNIPVKGYEHKFHRKMKFVKGILDFVHGKINNCMYFYMYRHYNRVCFASYSFKNDLNTTSGTSRHCRQYINISHEWCIYFTSF